MALKAL